MSEQVGVFFLSGKKKKRRNVFGTKDVRFSVSLNSRESELL